MTAPVLGKFIFYMKNPEEIIYGKKSGPFEIKQEER